MGAPHLAGAPEDLTGPRAARQAHGRRRRGGLAHREILGAGCSLYLAAFGLFALALSLGLWGYALSSTAPGSGGPLSGMNGVVGGLAILAAVCLLFIGLGVGAAGYKRQKRAASPPSSGGAR